jgi:uncharacterized protein (TIGR02145 family)
VKHKGICPAGWHLPNDDDWDILMSYIHTDNGLANHISGSSYYAGKYLKSTRSWDSNGTDKYGFAALPGGAGYSGGHFGNVGNVGYWWSASESSANGAYRRDMFYSSENADWNYNNKVDLFSVRCLQD